MQNAVCFVKVKIAQIIGRFCSIEIMRGNPTTKPSGSGAASVKKMRDEIYSQDFGVWCGTTNDIGITASRTDDRAKLLARVKLCIVGNSILLIDKTIAYSRDDKQEAGKNSNGARPASYIAMGIGILVAACCFGWFSIWHFIYSPHGRLWRVLVFLGVAEYGIWSGLSLLFG